MKCCPNCFSDYRAQAIIKELANGEMGTCDYCHSKDVPLVDISPECELHGYFDEILDVFAPADQVVKRRWLSEPQPLAQAFIAFWHVFAIEVDAVKKFLDDMFCDDAWFHELVDNLVVVTLDRGEKEVSDYSLFGTKSWEQFVSSIKNNLRFHTRFENEDKFEEVCNALSRSLTPEESWYRARIWNKDSVPFEMDLYEAPAIVTRNGRMNVAGIPCLYIADSAITAISETRAALHDTMAVAHIHPNRIMNIVDLSHIHDISPFEEIDCNLLAANIENLKLIRKELLRPMRRTDPELDYLPTEYISDLIKSLGYDGIGYKSVMCKDGYNVACFRTMKEGFMVEDISMHHIDGLSYESHIIS